jgi:hypothetical protein
MLYQLDTGDTENVPSEVTDALQHLMNCPLCAEEYHALRQALSDFENDTLPQLPRAPHFDLSFLESDRSPTGFWHTTAATKAQTLFTELVVLVGDLYASFAELPAPLFAEPLASHGFRSDAREEGQVEALILPAPDADISVQVLVGPLIEGRAAIALKLVEADTATAIPNTRITLRNSRRQLLEGSVTDKDGALVFEQLSHGRYVIQVLHKGSVWEIPFVVVKNAPRVSEDFPP